MLNDFNCWQYTVMEAFTALTSNSSITTKPGFQKVPAKAEKKKANNKMTPLHLISDTCILWRLNLQNTDFKRHLLQSAERFIHFINPLTHSHITAATLLYSCVYNPMNKSLLKCWLSLRWCWRMCLSNRKPYFAIFSLTDININWSLMWKKILSHSSCYNLRYFAY